MLQALIDRIVIFQIRHSEFDSYKTLWRKHITWVWLCTHPDAPNHGRRPQQSHISHACKSASASGACGHEHISGDAQAHPGVTGHSVQRHPTLACEPRAKTNRASELAAPSQRECELPAARAALGVPRNMWWIPEVAREAIRYLLGATERTHLRALGNLEAIYTLSVFTPFLGATPGLVTAYGLYIGEYFEVGGPAEWHYYNATTAPNGAYLFASSRAHFKEPFAGPSNIAFWTCGTVLFMLPWLSGTRMPNTTYGIGMNLALLGAASYTFHLDGSRMWTWQHGERSSKNSAMPRCNASLQCVPRAPSTPPLHHLMQWRCCTLMSPMSLSRAPLAAHTSHARVGLSA